MSRCDVCCGECDRPGEALTGNLAGQTAWICTDCREESKGRGRPMDTSADHARLADAVFAAVRNSLVGNVSATVERIADGFRVIVDPERVKQPANEPLDLNSLRVECWFNPADAAYIPTVDRGRTLEVLEDGRTCSILLSTTSARLLARALTQYADEQEARGGR